MKTYVDLLNFISYYLIVFPNNVLVYVDNVKDDQSIH